MRTKLLMMTALIGTIILAASGASATTVDIDFANVAGAHIVFSGSSATGGGTFSFSTVTQTIPTDGTVAATGDVTGAALGGVVNNSLNFDPIGITGSYGIGTVVGNTVPILPSSSNNFTIYDAGGNLTGTVSFSGLSFTSGSGELNYQLGLSLTNMSYSGSNPVLLALISDGKAVETITFTDNSYTTLSSFLAANATEAFAGDITAPIPPSALLLGSGLLGLVGLGWRRRKTMV